MDQKTGPLDFKDTLCIFIVPFLDHIPTVRALFDHRALRALRAVLAITFIDDPGPIPGRRRII